MEKLTYASLTPAYGRTYKTRNETIAAFYKGTDFKIYGGPYCSIRDFAKGAVVRMIDVRANRSFLFTV